jgi:hypothetical protein
MDDNWTAVRSQLEQVLEAERAQRDARRRQRQNHAHKESNKMSLPFLRRPPLHFWLGTLIAIVLLVAGAFWWPAISKAGATLVTPDPVAAAWAKAKAAGSYEFTSNITQVTVPTAKVTNVGRSSRSEELYLEGQSNLRENRMEMRIWSQGGNVLQESGSVAVKVEQGRSFIRQGVGDWQPTDNFTEGIAPQGDFMAYLAAMRAVTAHAPESRNGIELTRYSFTVDGPAFALYLRDQLEAALRAKGELPSGIHLDVPTYYREMTGDGELWIGSNGLPLRQILTLQFPELKEQQVHAQITVDFANFGHDATLLTGWPAHFSNWVHSAWGLTLPASMIQSLAGLVAQLPLLTGVAILAIAALLVVRYRRARLLYNSVAVAVMVSMSVGPVLSTMTNVRFFDAQSAKAAAQDEAAQEATATQAMLDAQRPAAFNPQQNPLEVAASAPPASVAMSANAAPATAVLAANPNAAPLPPGAIGWWPGENSPEDRFGDLSGVVNGTVGYAAGQVGQAFSFNGNNGYVALPDNLFPIPTFLGRSGGSRPFSFDLWFKTASGGVILGQQNGAVYTDPAGWINAIYVGTDGKLRAHMFGGASTITSVGTVNNNVFRHVAVTYDGATQRLYLDGALVGSTTYTQQPYANRYRYQLGTGFTLSWPAGINGWYNFNGLIDEPTLYNRALTASEVTAIYNASSNGKGTPTTDNNADLDNDGLSDFIEARLGSDPTVADSDDDGVPDRVELRGFALGGKTWYLNPNAADSNDDGLADGVECWKTPPAATVLPKDMPPCDLDTDGDGIPDVFDHDNDNDGVPDGQDLSPFTRATAANNGFFGDTTPFNFSMRNATSGKPVMVDVQLRPKDPKQLWYAFNVYDWPLDSKGQVQDVDRKTYADIAAAQGRTPDVNEAYGDLKLVPMVEIRFPANDTNLPTQAELTPYGISLRTISATTKAALVPLNLVKNEETGQRVAFSARMRYKPGSTWPTAHEMRFVWVVQALVDVPCDPEAEDAAQMGCTADGYIYNQVSPIQVYPGEFTVTGLNVREELGASMAVIYEDPAVDTNKKEEAALVMLSHGLENSFLAGRDADNNGQRDVTINTIVSRFDRLSNSAATTIERWSIPNILRVEKKDYAFYDEAVITTAMTETKRILNNTFSSVWTADKAIKPYLLFADEQQFRAVNLDSLSVSAGSVLDINFSPSGVAVETTTMTGLKGQPYCAPSATSPLWAPCAAEDYWDELIARYANQALLPGESDPNLTAARLLSIQLYFLSLSQGNQTIVQSALRLTSGRYTLPSDTVLEGTIRSALLGGGAGVVALANEVYLSRYLGSPTIGIQVLSKTWLVLQTIGDGLSGNSWNGFKVEVAKLRLQLAKLKQVPGKYFGIAALGVLAAGALIGGLLAGLPEQNLGRKILIRIVTNGITLVLGILAPLSEVASLVKSFRQFGISSPIKTALNMRSEVVGTSSKAAVIGAVIGVAVTWGFFLYSIISNQISAFSPEFNQALAETIATTIYLIFVTAVSSTIIGGLIVLFVTLVDGILAAICEVGDVQALRSVPGLGGACFGFGTVAIKVIAYLLYNYDIMVDTNRSDLSVLGSPKVSLSDPNKGYVAGNNLALQIPVTTTVRHKDPDPANGLYIYPYLWFYSADNLRSSTFRYSLTANSGEKIAVERNQMSSEWQNVVEDHKYLLTPMYRAQVATTASVGPLGAQPGLNQAVLPNFNIGYAVPAYECWGLPLPPFYIPIPVCYIRDFKGNISSRLDTFAFDIFPATVDGFAALAPTTAGSYKLSWDPAFRTLADADGDGLLSAAYGGLDPNDSLADTDGDGLTDANELERRQNGLAFSPTSCDTDNDGLTDWQEVQFGTNPAVADTDNDGLTDGEEVWHQVYDANCQPTSTWSGGWDITVGGVTTRVSSDPTRADSDNDGISDLAEKQLYQGATPLDELKFPFHPNIYNVTPINVIIDVNDANRVVALGQELVYTTTAVTSVPLAPGVIDITSSNLFPVQGAQAMPFNPATFNGSQTAVNRVSYIVAELGSGTVELKSTLRTRLPDTGQPPLVLRTPSVQSISGFTTWAPRKLDLAAPRAGTLDPFLLSVLTSNQASAGGNGEVRTYTLPGLQSVVQANNDATNAILRGENKPSMACNNAGDCLIAWDESIPSTAPSVTTGRILRVRAALVGANGQVKVQVSQQFPNFSMAPSVATDGDKFLMVFENLEAGTGAPAATTLYYALINADGTINNLFRVANTRTLLSGFTYLQTTANIQVAWIGDRYRITRHVARQSTLISRDVNSAGVEMTASAATLLTDMVSSYLDPHAFAYDPVSGRSMLVYQPALSTLHGYLYQGAATTPIKTSRLLNGGGEPRLSYDPLTRSFLLSYFGANSGGSQSAHMILDANMNQIGSAVSVPWGTGAGEEASRAMACPANRAAPLLNLRFEELPGATSFVDSTGNGYNATCSAGSCPAAGFPGATDKTGVAGADDLWGLASDRSVEFNSLLSGMPVAKTVTLGTFTLAFWFKAPPPAANTSPFLFFTGTNPTIIGNDDLTVRLFNGRLMAHVGPLNLVTAVSTAGRVDDNQWHFAVITRTPTTSSTAAHLRLYLDGSATPVTATGSSNTGVTIANKTLRIGGVSGAGLNGQLDGIQLYGVVLDDASTKALYERGPQPACAIAIQRTTSIGWTLAGARAQDTRGGRITATSNTLRLLIDPGPPTSAVTSVSNGQYVQGSASGRTIIIAGTATDDHSAVESVAVIVNGGSAQQATGTSTWSYPLRVTEGVYAIQSQATDASGWVEPSGGLATVRIFADAQPPNLSFTYDNQVPVRAVRNNAGQWTVAVRGEVYDPGTNSTSSEVNLQSVEVALQGSNGLVLGNDWQRATVTPQQFSPVSPWTLNYVLPAGVADPTDLYTVTVRAADNVGNRSQALNQLWVDNAGPEASLTTTNLSSGVLTTTITSPVTIGGLITDTGRSVPTLLQVAATPITQALAVSGTVVHLDFFDAANPLVDSAGFGNNGYCPSGSICPGTDVGRSQRSGDRALKFAANNEVVMIDAALPGNFTAAYWIKSAANVNNSTIIIDQGANVANGWTLSMDAGRPAFLVNTNEYLVSPNRIDDNGWHFVVGTRDRANGLIKLYVDGVLTGSRSAGVNQLTAFPNLRLGSDRSNNRRFTGSFDGLRLLNRVLSQAEVQALQAESTKPWQVGQVNFGGLQSSWQYQLPNSLEGIYQIDLDGGDSLTNRRLNNYAWRGVIDVVNPRVTLVGRATGQSYLDTATNTPRYEIAYTCRAEDFQLNEESFNCAGNSQRPPARSFNNDPILRSQFPDLTLLTTLVNTYTVWAESTTPTGSLTACDVYGRCTTVNATQASPSASGAGTVAAAEVMAASTDAAAAAPKTAIIAPTAGSVVNSQGIVQVSVAAQADQPLKEIVFLLDNTPVSTVSFAQHENVKQTVQTASVTVANAGTHTLAARATDWSGAQSQPLSISFVVDRQAPVAALTNSQVTKADSYGPQTNILRFRGTASDDAGLVAVQVKVGDQPYADATISGDQWRIAYPVTDPEGQQLAVKVRAIDAAGNVTEISQTLATDLSTEDAPDTTLVEKPADPSNSTTARFTFSGSATAVAFECQIDDAPAVPCTSPWTLNDLSNGSHTFRVAALNGQGFPDLTSASHTWTISVTTLATTLTAKPDAETTNRTASFSFTADGGVTSGPGFECSLDGSSYSACTSPKSYDKLRNGSHTFLVRAKADSTNGPATRYVWRVLNAAPTVTGDQVLMVAENSAVSIPLQAMDSDPLTYQIIEPPQHGLLQGVAPNLIYVPNTGYAGPDRFTYRAWDGEAASAPATVHITVRLGKYAVFAQEGVALEQNGATVVRGDVGVNVKSSGPFLRNNVEASFSQNSLMQDPTSRVLADSIVVDNNATIYNPSYNDLSGRGRVNGTHTTPLILPLRAGLPALPTVTAGTQAITVNGSQTLAPGSYGALTVNNDATLILSGGLYHFASWNVGQNAKLHFAAPSEVRVAGAVVISQNAYVGPAPNNTTVDANRIVLLVAGTNGQSNPGNFARSVTLEQNVALHGYVLAPNGLVNLSQNVNVTGAVVGKWVLVEQNSKLARPTDPPVAVASASLVADTSTPTEPVRSEVVATPVETPIAESVTDALYLPVVTNASQVVATVVDRGTGVSEEASTVETDIAVMTETTPLAETPVVTVTPVLTTTPVITTTPALTATEALTTTGAVTETAAPTVTTESVATDPSMVEPVAESAAGTSLFLPLLAKETTLVVSQ